MHGRPWRAFISIPMANKWADLSEFTRLLVECSAQVHLALPSRICPAWEFQRAVWEITSESVSLRCKFLNIAIIVFKRSASFINGDFRTQMSGFKLENFFFKTIIVERSLFLYRFWI